MIAQGADVQQLGGQIVLKTREISLGVSGSSQPVDRKVNLGLSLGVTSSGLPGPLNVAIGVGFKDGAAQNASLNAGMTTNYGTFGATGSVGRNERSGTEEVKVLGTWSLSL